MPRLPPERPAAGTIAGRWLDACPVHRHGCVVVGSGAAGLRAAVELTRRGGDVAIVSQSAWGGTSACSGSDKQTLHTANTADRGDDYKAMARAIRAGGAMDEDTAYVEAVGSSRAMASLQYLGLPLPQDPLGGTLRYQTDHDEVGRATSCGPRTSRLMVKVLAEEALRLGIPFYNHTTAVRILTDAGRVCGVLTVRPKQAGAENPFGLVLFQSPVLVLAAGGPGELYRDSVYPNGCFGSLGLALDAGIETVNLTESQFGIGTRREGFPWNLSGTYVQALPHIYSVDAERPRAPLPRRLLPHDPGARLERLPQGLPVAVPRHPDARLRLEPRRPRDLPRDAGRAAGLHGLQPQPRAGARRRALQPRPPRRGRREPTSAPPAPPRPCRSTGCAT